MANTYVAQRAAAQTEPWIEKLARVGYAAKGVIYTLIGVLALIAAAGPGGKTTNQAGAINTIAQQPFGMVVLLAIGVGLLGFALWRLIQAFWNPEHKKPLKRIGYVVSGLAYGGFGMAAISAAMTGERATSNSQQNAATVLSLPGGQLLMFVGAAIFVAVGVAQIANGLALNFTKILETERMSPEELRATMWFGRLGMVARGILFGLIGWFAFQAGMDRQPGEVGGVERGLQTIAQAPGGPLLLGLTALGLVCYGLFMFVEAKYRKMTPALRA
jgi:succinate dehydrogenase/fumarate reductase cytochrome b subunit